MKMHFTKMLSVCCTIIFGAFLTTDALAQGSTCETAVSVTPGDYSADGPIDGVSSAICEGDAGDFADWYSYTPAEDGFITVSSCGGGVDTQLSIFSGTCDALVCEDSNDDFVGCANFASQVVNMPVVGGTTYYIQWDNDWSDLGFDWSISYLASLEPDCEGVIGGPDVPGTSCDDGNPATFDDVYGEDCVCAGTPYDCPEQEANIGDPCDDLDPATFDDVYGEDCVCAGTPPSIGSTCETALEVGEGSHTADGPSDGISSDICEGDAGDFADWYSYTPAEDGFITVSSCEGGVDTQLSIFSGTCDALVCEDSNDDFDGCANFASEVQDLAVTGGTTYYIQWDNDWSEEGFDWSITFAVADCNGEIGGPALPGTSCDDGNPDTENDVWGDDCVCAGTPIEEPCSDPFPAVDDASMDATFDETALTVELTWDPVPGSIACQVQGREVGTADVYKTLIEGVEPSSYTVQPFRLDYGTTYEWRVRCGCSIDPVVAGPWSGLHEFTTPSGTEITSSPNPTQGVSFVSFNVPTDGMTTLEVFDMSGRSIDVLFSGNAQADNEYRFEFDGSHLPNGVYIYRLMTEKEIVNEKFMIAR